MHDPRLGGFISYRAMYGLLYESKFHKDPVTEVARPRATLSGMYHNTLAISSLSLCLLSLGPSRPTSGQQLRLSLRTDLPWRKEGGRIHAVVVEVAVAHVRKMVVSGHPTSSAYCLSSTHSSLERIWLYATELSDDCFPPAQAGSRQAGSVA